MDTPCADADHDLRQLDDHLSELRDRLGLAESGEITETTKIVAPLQD